MSGGSYDYLSAKAGDVVELGVIETIERMRDRLQQLAAERDPDGKIGYAYAAARTQWVLDGFACGSGWARFLGRPWHAVEWLDSRDWGVDQADDAVREWFWSDDDESAGRAAWDATAAAGGVCPPGSAGS